MDKIEGYYQARAKEVVDMLFDKGYFREDVSRDGMKDVEDFIAWDFQTQCESAKRITLLTKRIKNHNG